MSLPSKDKDLDYAIGRLVAEVSALRESDERLTAELKGFSGRMDEIEAGANAAKGAIKAASWLLGIILTSILALGSWMVRSTIVNEEQREVMHRDLQSHISSGGHPGTLDVLYEVRTNIQAIQLMQTEEANHNKSIDSRIERLERRRR